MTIFAHKKSRPFVVCFFFCTDWKNDILILQFDFDFMTGDFSCREEQVLVATLWKYETGRLLSRNNNHLLSFMAIHLMQWDFPIASFFNFFIAGFTFADCRSLTVAPIIPATVTDIDWTFSQCFNLTETITINANPSSYSKCFQNIDMTNITLTGSASKDVLNLIGSTGRNWTPIS